MVKQITFCSGITPLQSYLDTFSLLLYIFFNFYIFKKIIFFLVKYLKKIKLGAIIQKYRNVAFKGVIPEHDAIYFTVL